MIDLTHTIDNQWLRTLELLVRHGREVAPRGRKTLELPQHTVHIDARRPVLLSPARKLSYQFMAAEAFWILSGDDRADAIVPFNRHIAQFSDDGVTFAGAYGPRIVSQLDYVVAKLAEDQESRQAGLTIWLPNPKPSKDIPCTVAVWFQLRDQLLHTHVFMRSSDVWLGLPYDLFNFSMLAHLVCGLYRRQTGHLYLSPGSVHLTAVSSHLYEEQWADAAVLVADGGIAFEAVQSPTPDAFFESPSDLMLTLSQLRHTKAGDKLRWWL